MDDDCPHSKPGELFYFFTRRHGCYECKLEQHEAWVQGVKQRLDEALFHLAHGLDATWDRLPCAKYPHCDQILGGGWAVLPEELCPGCGRSWAGVPAGHAFTFADGGWRCRDAEPVGVEEFVARTRRG